MQAAAVPYACADLLDAIATMPTMPDAYAGCTLLPTAVRRRYGYTPLCRAVMLMRVWHQPQVLAGVQAPLDANDAFVLLIGAEYDYAARVAGDQPLFPALDGRQPSDRLIHDLWTAVQAEKSATDSGCTADDCTLVARCVQPFAARQVTIDFDSLYVGVGGYAA